MADLGGDGVQIGDGTDTGDIAALITQHRTDIDAIDSVTGAVSVASIAALTALPKSGLTDDDYVIVKGYYAPNDGGGGLFQWDAASTATANIGTVFAADEGGTGRWLRDMAGADHLNARWFGAKIDDVTDDTAAIQAAIDLKKGRVFIPPNTTLGGRGIPITQLKIYNGTYIYGAGSGTYGHPGTRLRQVNGSNLSLIVPDPGIATSEYMHNVRIHDLALEGRWDNAPAGPEDGTSTGGCGIDMDRRIGETFKVYNVFARYFAESGIRFSRGSTPGSIENCSSFHNGEYGFDFSHGAADVWHQFSATALSGDDNEIALIHVYNVGFKYDMIVLENIKAETNQTGKQQDVVVIESTNYCQVKISDVAQQNVGGTTSNSVVRNTSATGCRLILSNIRASIECANFVDDEFKSLQYANTSVSASAGLVDGYWDSALENPGLHLRTKDNHFVSDRVSQAGTAAPTTAYHYRGEFVFNSTPSTGGVLGWRCTAAGTPGTWETVPFPT